MLAKYPQYGDMVDTQTIQNVPGAVPGWRSRQNGAGPPKASMSHVFTPQEFGKGFIGTIPAMLKNPGATAESMVQPGLAAGMSPIGEGYPAFASLGAGDASGKAAEHNNAMIQANAQIT